MSTDSAEDVSLIFWILIWTVLAFVATLVYYIWLTKPCFDPSATECADEQVARKLVKEISKKGDLVKRTTFRRQRSYEIVDGEVRIHYDVPFYMDHGNEPTTTEKNILISAEVDTFPLNCPTIEEESERLLAANLPRIIEEGEEIDEDFINEGDQVEISKDEVVLLAEKPAIDANVVINKIGVSSLRENECGDKTQKLNNTCSVYTQEKVRRHTEVVVENMDIPPKTSKQITQSVSASSPTFNHGRIRPAEHGTDDHGWVLQDDNRAMNAPHSSNTPDESLYRLTEVRETLGRNFSVTRKTFKKLKSPTAETSNPSQNISDASEKETYNLETETKINSTNKESDLNVLDESSFESHNDSSAHTSSHPCKQGTNNISSEQRNSSLNKEPDVVNKYQLPNENVTILPKATNMVVDSKNTNNCGVKKYLKEPNNTDEDSIIANCQELLCEVTGADHSLLTDKSKSEEPLRKEGVKLDENRNYCITALEILECGQLPAEVPRSEETYNVVEGQGLAHKKPEGKQDSSDEVVEICGIVLKPEDSENIKTAKIVSTNDNHDYKYPSTVECSISLSPRQQDIATELDSDLSTKGLIQIGQDSIDAIDFLPTTSQESSSSNTKLLPDDDIIMASSFEPITETAHANSTDNDIVKMGKSLESNYSTKPPQRELSNFVVENIMPEDDIVVASSCEVLSNLYSYDNQNLANITKTEHTVTPVESSVAKNRLVMESDITFAKADSLKAEQDDDVEDDIIVAYGCESIDKSDVIVANQVMVTEITPNLDNTVAARSYKKPQSTVQVVVPKFTDTTFDHAAKPTDTSNVVKPQSKTQSYIDTSDIDEIDIENIPEDTGRNQKSKSVTDLDEALASFASQDTISTNAPFDDTSSISKSVPDNLDSYAPTLVKVSMESLPGITPKNLSVSSPEIAKVKGSDKVKKVTKIKIVKVKFLEMQEDSGLENIEEDSFTIEGDKCITGKVKRRSGHFSPPDLSPVISPEAIADSQTTQSQFGFNLPYKAQHTAPATIEQPQQGVATAKYLQTMIPQDRHVARFGLIQPQSTDNTTLKLSDKFQMNSSSHNKKKTYPQGNIQPHVKQLLTSNQTRHKVKGSKSRGKSSGQLVTVKGSVINTYHECSSDADSEMSYTSLSPPIRTKRMSHTVGTNKEHDSASSSEPDSPRSRMLTKPKNVQNATSLDSFHGTVSSDNKLFSRFQIEENTNLTQPMIFDSQESNTRFVEFNPFANIEGYDDLERSDSPTSVMSDTSSVFSFNCDFDAGAMPESSYDAEVYMCENPTCQKHDIDLGSEKTSYKSCPACFTYYCSSQCRKLHWPVHKQNCYFGRVNTYVRSIIRLCQHRQDLSMYLSQLARDGYKKKGRGVVMATFNSPELARQFIIKGSDAFSGRNPTYSSLVELSKEGVISKHRVALMQAVRDYEPNEEFVYNIAVVAVHDVPITPAPRYKLNTVLHCIKMALNEKIVTRQPYHGNRVESRLFALPKCSRHEFVNEMEARRHYCRNLSKNLRQYNIKLKEDYPECYKKLCMYVEHDVSFEPMTVFGQRNNLTYKCIIAPEQNYALKAEYC